MQKLPEILAGARELFVENLRISFRGADVVHLLETLCVTVSCYLVLTLAIFGFRVDSWMHEWANFLNHFLAASPAARLPVQVSMISVFIIIFGFVLIARGRFGKVADNG